VLNNARYLKIGAVNHLDLKYIIKSGRPTPEDSLGKFYRQLRFDPSQRDFDTEVPL
jgi:hypothetical protein